MKLQMMKARKSSKSSRLEPPPEYTQSPLDTSDSDDDEDQAGVLIERRIISISDSITGEPRASGSR